MLAAEETCLRRGWRLAALSWYEAHWTAVVESQDPLGVVQARVRGLLRKAPARTASVWTLPRPKDVERAIGEAGGRGVGAFFVAGV
jgi:hypothetical protein